MKCFKLRLLAGVLTFCIGLMCTVQYQDYVVRRQEKVLQSDLVQMRAMIQRYYEDNFRQPDSLGDLVRSGYLTEVPVDPMTGMRDWKEEQIHIAGGFDVWGLVGVHSASTAISSDGRPYEKW